MKIAHAFLNKMPCWPAPALFLNLGFIPWFEHDSFETEHHPGTIEHGYEKIAHVPPIIAHVSMKSAHADAGPDEEGAGLCLDSPEKDSPPLSNTPAFQPISAFIPLKIKEHATMLLLSILYMRDLLPLCKHFFNECDVVGK